MRLRGYSFSALKERHNAAEVRYTDPNNGWETSTELVENDAAIRRYGRNVLKMDAFACTSRGQAHRAGLWAITTELLETQTVDFSVGAEGLRHVPGDIIEVCDSDYAGVTVGGRVLSVDSLTRTLTLDREVEIPTGGNVVLNLVGSNGQPVTVAVTAHPAPDRVTVSQLPDGVAEYSVWGLKLPDLRQRLFRCVAIRENDDGTYAITAVQHVPEKGSIVDNGATFDPLPDTSITNMPPAVQHLTTEILAEEGQYQARARWDTPRVVKGVNFSLRLTVKAEDNSDRLASSLTLTETEHTFRNLTPGRYTLTVRAVNTQGQQGDPASTDFSIAAPAVPSCVELTPGYFQITAIPRQAVYDPTVQYEFWFTDTQIANIRKVETDAHYLGTAPYWIAASSSIKPGKDYYFYIRAVNQVGKSAFVEAKGQASNDAAGYLDFFKGKITESHLGKELLEKVELTEDNASRLDEFSKEWQDANGKWNAMWGVKIEQTGDGRHYVAGLGLSMEDTPDGKASQFLVAADRIAFINPQNGNQTPGFVMQGDQIIMNEVFLKYLSAPTITSGGNPPAFSLTPDGRLTAKNADISGHINAISGALNNVVIAEDCTIQGTLRAERILGDIVKAVGKEFPYFREPATGAKRYASGTLTVQIDDDQSFDRQIIIPPINFQGSYYGRNDTWDTCTLEVRRNGALIYSGTSSSIPESYGATLDMPEVQEQLKATVAADTQRAEAAMAGAESAAAASRGYRDEARDIAENLAPGDASTTQKRLVRLSSETGSESEVLAATSKAVKKVKDLTDRKAPLDSPELTGTPLTPTPPLIVNNKQIVNAEFVHAVVAALVGASPEALDTLAELAEALGNDPNFATTMLNVLAGKQPLNETLTNLSGKDVAGLLRYLGMNIQLRMGPLSIVGVDAYGNIPQ
ncbi:DUF1983 domain-containing protein [Salmonella enterica]|uniref:DUF1983 domain-containing protein n=3 Tax=Salmonella enterica TaxID=28901 RepID=A0A402XL84_SALER|nr:hypothetical protein DOE60_01050 [Salmonella enterica subsp. salamae serovar 56:z10:e,n,x]EAY9565563.1 DUF1983 domain-containing protein [Salmonella enterica]EBQ2951152.1 DUF1983 domain-containing protein [Salmonella enterica]MIV66152.1 DUF1983 domain-containing protein [Salmonella enterica]HCM2047630.1 DUF1983 domain-containing protein [Salmonella enterica subsp. salamae serovar 56:z10:e,n,x]